MDCFNLRVSRLDDVALAQHDAALLQATSAGAGAAAPATRTASGAPLELPATPRTFRRIQSSPSRTPAAAAAATGCGSAAPSIGFGGLPLPVSVPLPWDPAFGELPAEVRGRSVIRDGTQ